MKKVKFRYQISDEGEKKSIMKFRDVEDDDDDRGSERDPDPRRRKDVGKRLHRKKTPKDDF